MVIFQIIFVIVLAIASYLALKVICGESLPRLRRKRRPAVRPPAADRSIAIEYGLAWVADDGQMLNHPLVAPPELEPEPELNLPPKQHSVEDPMVVAERDRRDAQLARHDADRARRDEWLDLYCRPAAADDYAEFLQAYLRNGGQTTHDYDYDLPGHFYVLRPDAMPPSPPTCYGALLFEVIVPADSQFPPAAVPRTFHGVCGHSAFYFVNVGGYPAKVALSVPTYRDVRRLLAS